MAREIDVAFPDKMLPSLFEEHRYKVYYGGRGGGKSTGIGISLVIRAHQKSLRILCVRETMTSMEDSVHKLLSDQIHVLGLQDEFTIEKKTIYHNTNGSEFRFAGIRSNPDALKSAEGIDICWAEEAQTITKASWQKLIPTIRKKGSEIIISFNPELEIDETYQRFVVNTPPNSSVVKINYLDNPWCPEILKTEADYMKEVDPEAYHNVWLGFPMVARSNAVYGRELREMEAEDRIGRVTYDPAVPVHRFWDLGWRDSTSIILAQMVGFEFHVIDFVEGNQTSITDYLRILQRKPYLYGVDYLPHDAKAKERGTGRSIEELMRNNGCTVRIVPSLSIMDGINAVRTMMPRVHIDQKHCSELLHHLRHYIWDEKATRQMPLHDSASHAADAFRYMAISLTDAKPGKDVWKRTKAAFNRATPSFRRFSDPNTSWMA